MVVLLTVVAGALWARVAISMPSRTEGGSAALPLWVMLPLLAASAIAAGLDSDMADLEASAARRLWPLEIGYLGAATATTAGLLAAAFARAGLGPANPEIIRNLVLWVGLAVLSGRLFNRRLTWVVPLAVLFAVHGFGFGYATQTPLWWAVPLAPAGPVSTACALGVLVAGVAVATASPWRTRRGR